MNPPNPPDPLPPIPLLLALMFTRAAEEVTRAHARVCPGVATQLNNMTKKSKIAAVQTAFSFGGTIN